MVRSVSGGILRGAATCFFVLSSRPGRTLRLTQLYITELINTIARQASQSGQGRYCTIKVSFALCVSVVEPEVKFPVTLMVYVPACGLPPPPPPEPPPHELNVIPSITSTANATIRPRARLCSRRQNNVATTIKRNIPAQAIIMGMCQFLVLLGQSPANGRTRPCATVVTEIIAVCVAVPLSAIMLGDTAQLDPAGPPLQLNVTLCANPPAGAIAIE